MSLAVAIQSAMEENEDRPVQDDLASVAQDAVIETLSDDAVRREVFESVRWDLDEISMLEIHKVMDSLIDVLKGTNADGE